MPQVYLDTDMSVLVIDKYVSTKIETFISGRKEYMFEIDVQ
jgi:hypothetical protein